MFPVLVILFKVYLGMKLDAVTHPLNFSVVSYFTDKPTSIIFFPMGNSGVTLFPFLKFNF